MTANKLLKTTAFYALVVVIVVFSVFPFYYAIVTSFATGTELFKVNYFPRSFDWSNYTRVLGQRNFAQSILNSVFIATTTVVFALFLAVTASYALARVRFRGRGLACCCPSCRWRFRPRRWSRPWCCSMPTNTTRCSSAMAR